MPSPVATAAACHAAEGGKDAKAHDQLLSGYAVKDVCFGRTMTIMKAVMTC
jgi:hypothetical protein